MKNQIIEKTDSEPSKSYPWLGKDLGYSLGPL